MRLIKPELKAMLDAKLGAESHALGPVDLMLKAASALIGVTEANASATVNLIRGTVAKPWGEAWCDDFVQSCIAYVEAVKGLQSSIVASEGVLDTWNRSKAYSAVPWAKKGDMILWRLGTTAEGHCGLITDLDSLRYHTIEGNTSDSAEIDRTGRGVFAKLRAKGGTKTFAEVGFLRPFS